MGVWLSQSHYRAETYQVQILWLCNWKLYCNTVIIILKLITFPWLTGVAWASFAYWKLISSYIL